MKLIVAFWLRQATAYPAICEQKTITKA